MAWCFIDRTLNSDQESRLILNSTASASTMILALGGWRLRLGALPRKIVRLTCSFQIGILIIPIWLCPHE